jgi:DNA-binding response OmpR family regulator
MVVHVGGHGPVSVLWVDDEPRICEAAVRVLKPRFVVEAYTDPDAFMIEARARRHQLVVIDWNLRTCEGTDLCATLRSEGDVRPIALLSGKLATEHAKELAVQCGASKFIEKTAFETWAPQLEALLALPPGRTASGNISRRTPLELDGNVLKVRSYAATMRAKELAILEILLEDPIGEHSREEIARRVWGRHGEPETTLVDSVISSIRKKLGAARDLIERGPHGWRIQLVLDEKMREKKLK